MTESTDPKQNDSKQNDPKPTKQQAALASARCAVCRRRLMKVWTHCLYCGHGRG